jgi:outer membrane protein assembly factor BamB
MRKLNLVVLFLLLICIHSFAQSFKFGWITDLNIGHSNADMELNSLVDEINKRTDLKFVLITGDITERGKNEELESAKKILDNLKIKYFLIPGTNDVHWSESACSKWKEIWKDDKFEFEYNGIRFIGISGAIPWQGGKGHISPENLNWLDNILAKINQQQEIILVLNNQLESEIDNWFEVTNKLINKNIVAVISGQGEKNKHYNFHGIDCASIHSSINLKTGWEDTQVESRQDTLAFYQITKKDSIPKQWGIIYKQEKIDNPKVDSLQLINYNAELLWQKQLKRTFIVPPLVWNEKIYIASRSGILSCFDLDGNQLWEYDTYAPVFSRPVIADNILAIGNIRGDLITLEPLTGNQIQTIGLDDIITSQLITIDYEGKKLLMTGKKPKTVIVIGTASGRILCYDLICLEPIWENKSAKGMIQTRPLYIKNKLIFGSWDGNLYCVDARTGTMNWKWADSKNIYESPAVCLPVTDGKNVFITARNKYVSAIDLLLGRTVWRKNIFNSWESIGINLDNNLLVKSSKDRFCYISGKNGNMIKEINLNFGEDKMPSALFEVNGNIVFGSQNGCVYSINKNYNTQKVLFLGTAGILDVQNIKEDIYTTLNIDGTLSVFRLKNKE